MYASRGFDFHIAFYIQNLIYVICVCLRIVVSNTYWVVFFGLFFVVLCTLCCQCLWTVHVRLPLWYSLTFIDQMVCGINEEWNICKHLLRFSLHCNLNKTLCMLESWCYLWFGYMWLYLYRYFCLRIVPSNTYIEQYESHWKRRCNLRWSWWVCSSRSTYGTRLVISYAVMGLSCNCWL